MTKSKTTSAPEPTVSAAQIKSASDLTNVSNYFVYLVSTPETSIIVPQKSTASAIAAQAAMKLHKDGKKVVFVKNGTQVTDEQKAGNVIVAQHRSIVAGPTVVPVN